MGNPKKRIWTNKFSIGNTKIDNEHKKLFEVYDDLVEFLVYKNDREEFAKILTRMTNYSLNHFKNEERYMRKMNYPKLQEHENYHRRYIFEVAMYNVDLLSSTPPNPKDIIKFLKKWWTNHIMIHDNRYEHYKKEIKYDLPY